MSMRDPYTPIDWIFQIERFMARIEEMRGSRRSALLHDEFQEIIEFNILRAIESAIDLARHVHFDQRYDDPRREYPGIREYRHLYFEALADNGVISVSN